MDITPSMNANMLVSLAGNTNITVCNMYTVAAYNHDMVSVSQSATTTATK